MVSVKWSIIEGRELKREEEARCRGKFLGRTRNLMRNFKLNSKSIDRYGLEIIIRKRD